MAFEITTPLRLRAASIGSVLEYYFPTPPIPLNSIDAFTFLVAVSLSAQTTGYKDCLMNYLWDAVVA